MTGGGGVDGGSKAGMRCIARIPCNYVEYLLQFSVSQRSRPELCTETPTTLVPRSEWRKTVGFLQVPRKSDTFFGKDSVYILCDLKN